MVDARFSALAAVTTGVVAALAALDDAAVVAVIWAALAAGFAIRAAAGFRRR